MLDLFRIAPEINQQSCLFVLVFSFGENNWFRVMQNIMFPLEV